MTPLEIVTPTGPALAHLHVAENQRAGLVLGHGAVWHCAAGDIDETPAAERLPDGDGAVGVYNPRQQRELEANVFAVAFLLPAEELRAGFLAGDSYRRLAGRFGASPAAALNALATSLLTAPAAAPAGRGTTPAPVPTPAPIRRLSLPCSVMLPSRGARSCPPARGRNQPGGATGVLDPAPGARSARRLVKMRRPCPGG